MTSWRVLCFAAIATSGAYDVMTCVVVLQQSRHLELMTFINLNLAIVYLRLNRQADLMALVEHIDPERIPPQWVARVT